MISSEALTIKEAAVLARVTEKVIRHELSSKIVGSRRRGAKHVEFDPRAVLYLSLVSSLRVELTKEDRRDLFELITSDRCCPRPLETGRNPAHPRRPRAGRPGHVRNWIES